MSKISAYIEISSQIYVSDDHQYIPSYVHEDRSRFQILELCEIFY